MLSFCISQNRFWNAKCCDVSKSYDNVKKATRTGLGVNFCSSKFNLHKEACKRTNRCDMETCLTKREVFCLGDNRLQKVGCVAFILIYHVFLANDLKNNCFNLVLKNKVWCYALQLGTSVIVRPKPYKTTGKRSRTYICLTDSNN